MVPVTLRFIYTDVETGVTQAVESETYLNASMINFVDFQPPFQRFRIEVALKNGEISGPRFSSNIEHGKICEVASLYKNTLVQPTCVLIHE